MGAGIRLAVQTACQADVPPAALRVPRSTERAKDGLMGFRALKKSKKNREETDRLVDRAAALF